MNFSVVLLCFSIATSVFASSESDFNLGDNDEAILVVAVTEDEPVGREAIKKAVEAFVGQVKFRDDNVYIVDQFDTDDEVEEEKSYRPIAGLGAGAFIPFGVGHALQGRWGDSNGAIFTFGQLAAVASTFMLASKGKEKLAVASFVAFGGLRIWEVVDLASGIDWGDSTLQDIGIAGVAGFVGWKTFDKVKDLFWKNDQVALGSDSDGVSFMDSIDVTVSRLNQGGEQGIAIGLVLPLN